MNARTVLVALFLISLLAACTLPFAGSSTGDYAPLNPASILTPVTDPIQLAVTPDLLASVSHMVPVEGATLDLTAPDGTHFRLEIPANALNAATQITLTAVSSITGLPAGGEQTHAVQLEPEGLFFNNFVTLTITPPQPIPVDQQILFGYEGASAEMTLATPVVGSETIQILLLHFSGYGVTKGLLADLDPVRQRIGGAAEARLQSQIAQILQRERQRLLLGGDEESNIDWSTLFREWEEQVVKPRLAAAGESCAAGRLALQTVLSFERMKQLLGVSDGSTNFPADLMDTVANVCMKEEYEMCRDDHIIHRIVPAWLSLERQYQLLGAGENSPGSEQAKQYVSKCLSFELRFESQATLDTGEGGYTSSMQSTVKLKFDTNSMSMQAEAPLVNTAFDFWAPGCSTTNNRGGSTFRVFKLEYISDTKSPTDTLGYVRDFNLIYYPENSTESYTIYCEDGSYTSPPIPYWTAIFSPLHIGEMSQAQGGFIAQDWEIFGDEYFAKKEWIKEDTGLQIVEAGTFKLYHRPQ